ncbi:MAG: DNA-binding proteins Bright/BRCAA1/RBP1 and proteins containing BRIGHT domain [Thelocarpon impressellum]|nr:MAG: DNA-binding proteins Bright/BRCAA1/RBP1 and proteins containing BRIGHT domain [Thelocarpon impressellum]
MAASRNASSVAMALAGKTASVDIPKPRAGGSGRDGFTAVAARSLPAKNASHTLPTPPNSISPLLPPRGFKAATSPHEATPPAQVDSDIDLHDAVPDQAAVTPQHGFSVAALDALPSAPDAAGAITPALLAKHHLPDILLAHGPLAIRHVMGYLTTSVPGFSRIPPAKARRLVVGALEGRGSGGEGGGGVDGSVEFDKVGWGRWDARIKGQPPREQRGVQQNTLLGVSPPASVPSSYSALSPRGMPIRTHQGGRWPEQVSGIQPGTSWTGDSAAFSHDEDNVDPMYPEEEEDVTMLEHEADKMSLDSCSSSEANDAAPDEELGDVTDDEDWAGIGAAALRQAGSGPAHRGGIHHIRAANGPGISQNTLGGIGSDLQEREAIEALVRLSSV